MKHFEEYLKESELDFVQQARNIWILFAEERISYQGNYFWEKESVVQIIDSFFRQLPISVNRLKAAEVFPFSADNVTDLESFSVFVEAASTLIAQAEETVDFDDFPGFVEQIDSIKKLIRFDLTTCGCELKFKNTPNYGKVAFVCLKNENTALAMSLAKEDSVKEKLLEFTKVSNKGNLKAKKSILVALANPIYQIIKMDEFKNRYGKLEDDVDRLLNNADIRHPNKEGKEATLLLQTASIKELEDVYDLVYELFLQVVILAEFPSLHQQVEKIRHLLTSVHSKRSSKA